MKKRALFTVSDKHSLGIFAKDLLDLGNWEIVSTGGTADSLREVGIEVSDVSVVTGFPECLDGRVKTLHPAVHAGVLATKTSEHINEMHKLGLQYFDLVVCNLYPFEQTVAQESTTYQQAIEKIDIGGPTVLRGAAKNHDRMIVVCDPVDYQKVIAEMRENDDNISSDLRQTLAIKVFRAMSNYDAAIVNYMELEQLADRQEKSPQASLNLE